MRRWLRRCHTTICRWVRFRLERNSWHRILLVRLWREEEVLGHLEAAGEEMAKAVELRKLLDGR